MPKGKLTIMAMPETQRLSLIATHSSSLNTSQSNDPLRMKTASAEAEAAISCCSRRYFRTVKPSFSKKGAALADFR
ncbi:hypothetical protein D3C73_746550 [compost metagenome]